VPINLDPNKMAAYRLSVPQVISAVKDANRETGGRVIEWAGTEFMVRGRGYVRSVEDIAAAPVGATMQGVPIRLRDVATVTTGPDMRRGFADLNGAGEAVGGIVVMRYGENAEAVTRRVRERLKEIQPSLPPGARVVITYDRSDLIQRAIRTISETLIEELVIISLLIILFLWHFRSALVPVISLPLAVVVSFIPMYLMGLGTNIMALGGIIVALGDMVDAAIVLVENAVKRLTDAEATGAPFDRDEFITSSAKEVGPAIFASLLVMAVSFMPIFTLEAQEGRLFKPLAFTKNFASSHRRRPGHHPHPGNARALRPGQAPARAETPRQPQTDFGLPSRGLGGLEVALADPRDRGAALRRKHPLYLRMAQPASSPGMSWSSRWTRP